MGERINKALYKVEEKKQKRAARRAQVSIREAGSGLVERITICHNITRVFLLTNFNKVFIENIIKNYFTVISKF